MPPQTESLRIELNLSAGDLKSLVSEIVTATKVQPELVDPSEVKVPNAYKRFRNLEGKQRFRQSLLSELALVWKLDFGEKKALDLAQGFKSLSKILYENGAIVFGDLITREDFERLVVEYDRIMRDAGSLSLLHSYVDLRNHSEFLSNESFNDAFLHPLIIALMAYMIGGPVRIIDARGKDAQPLTARAQDNMLHIDNTPFNDEYKVLVTWEKGKTSGPKGQNFVFLPGTHKGARNCFISEEKKAWSTENASIFITVESIRDVFEFQKKVRQEGIPAVIEVQDRDRPLTTVFAAGSLVHHRFRTDKGYARSCIIIAFHPSNDNPGQFIDGVRVAKERDICRCLLGYQDYTISQKFVGMILRNANNIGLKISEIFASEKGTVIVNQEQKILSPNELEEWKTIATSAPEIEDLKKQKQKFPFGQKLTLEEFMTLLGNSMMLYDKHGPLDLILYEDNHEEIRKWARNRIREMRHDHMNARLRKWAQKVKQPVVDDVLSPDELVMIAHQMIQFIDGLNSSQRKSARMDEWERISPENAYRSVRQLIEDLAEAIARCYSLQNFLSTSLFLFWSCDELCQLQSTPINGPMSVGGKLLRHYVATAILVHMLNK
jgi:hypothetical protein